MQQPSWLHREMLKNTWNTGNLISIGTMEAGYKEKQSLSDKI